MRGMMARSDMEATLREAVMGMDGTEKEKKAALQTALKALDAKCGILSSCRTCAHFQ